MTVYRGRCHCGAGGFDYETAIAPADWPMRACQCSFCQKHGAVYTSDPNGALRWTHADPSLLLRYRFGHKTADFVFCRPPSRCPTTAKRMAIATRAGQSDGRRSGAD